MKNTVRKKKLTEAVPTMKLTLADMIRADLHDFVISAGTAALADLRDRGMHTDRGVLAVIDGSKALAKAIRDVLDQLPEDMRPSVRQALREAYGSAGASRAKRLLANLVRRLRDAHPGAAVSLDEGLDETLTVKRLGLPPKGAVRRLTRRVKRWRGGRMILRWTVTAVADAADRLRRITGARDGMTALVRALKDHENALAGVSRRSAA